MARTIQEIANDLPNGDMPLKDLQRLVNELLDAGMSPITGVFKPDKNHSVDDWLLDK